MVRGEHVPNHRLGAYYSSAGIVLNDHWPDMARRGFVSNRIFDAGLAGAFVISDDFAGKEMFYGSVVTCADAEDLEVKALHFLENAEARQALADRLRRIVLAAHTFDHRARDLVRVARRTLAFRLGLPIGAATTNVDAPAERTPDFGRAGA
jgi:spore maturation protein CgeB